MSTSFTGSAPEASHERPRVSPLKRIIAGWIDYLIASVLTFPAALAEIIALGRAGEPLGAAYFILWALSILALLAYFMVLVVMLARKGASPGSLIFGYRIHKYGQNAQVPGWGIAAGRVLLGLVAWLVCFGLGAIGLAISIAVSREGRGLHDTLVGTEAVPRGASTGTGASSTFGTQAPQHNGQGSSPFAPAGQQSHSRVYGSPAVPAFGSPDSASASAQQAPSSAASASASMQSAPPAPQYGAPFGTQSEPSAEAHEAGGVGAGSPSAFEATTPAQWEPAPSAADAPASDTNRAELPEYAGDTDHSDHPGDTDRAEVPEYAGDTDQANHAGEIDHAEAPEFAGEAGHNGDADHVAEPEQTASVYVAPEYTAPEYSAPEYSAPKYAAEPEHGHEPEQAAAPEQTSDVDSTTHVEHGETEYSDPFEGHDPAETHLEPTELMPSPIPATEAETDRTVIRTQAEKNLALVFDDGTSFDLPDGTDIVLGRNPQAPEGAQAMSFLDDTRSMSKTHARLRRDGEAITVHDAGSTNGTALVDDDGNETIIEGDMTSTLRAGSKVRFGDRIATIEERTA